VGVVMNGGCRCWAGEKHLERTHVKLRGGASLRRGKSSGQYKRELIMPWQWANFSAGDAVECLSWSRKLSCSERGQHLDGCPLHVTVVWNQGPYSAWTAAALHWGCHCSGLNVYRDYQQYVFSGDSLLNGCELTSELRLRYSIHNDHINFHI
jgi:hypothetical protein